MQMWNSGRFLPLAVGSYVSEEDKHWKHFLLLDTYITNLLER